MANEIVQLGERITVERLMEIRYGNPSTEFLKLPAHKRDAVKQQAMKRYSQRTVETYNSRIFEFQLFCAGFDVRPYPLDGQIVSAFITDFAGRHTYKTIQNYIAALAAGQRILGLPSIWSDPCLRDTLAGIRHEHGSAITKQDPILREMLDDCIDQALRHPIRVTALRNAIIFGLGYEIAARGGEVRAARRKHLKRRKDGYTYFFPNSKTDQGGEGYTVGVVTDPLSRHDIVALLDEYRALLPEDDGPVVPRIDRNANIKDAHVSLVRINQVIKATLSAAGVSPTKRSSHSLRSGSISQNTMDGMGDDDICKESRHKSRDAMLGYQRLDPDAIIARKITMRLLYGAPA